MSNYSFYFRIIVYQIIVLFLMSHKIGFHELYLHDSVVDGDEGCEQVQISGGEDQCKQHLRLPRNT